MPPARPGRRTETAKKNAAPTGAALTEGRKHAEEQDALRCQEALPRHGQRQTHWREQANKRHLLEHKSSRRTRRLAMDQPVDRANLKSVKSLLGR